MEETGYTIEEAVEYTGIKRRTFENMKVSYVEEYRTAKDGKERKVRIYSQSALDLVKATKNKKHVPAVVDMQMSATNATEFATVNDLQNIVLFLTDFIKSENQKLLPSTEETKKRQIDISTFKDKLILNFSQALAYSGLPEDELKNALKANSISGRKTSENGTWKISRSSLEEFCRSYFE
jgi:hypothetical protein